jgi:glycine betaine/choline ABC-type transport system substrate-binding protein
MTHAARSSVKVVGVTRVEVMEDSVKIASRSFEEQMIVIGHQTETVDSRSVTVGRRLQIAKKTFVILFDSEDVFVFIAS